VRVVAVVSGGPDSLSYAAHYCASGHEIYALVFDYGQKARREISTAVRLLGKLNERFGCVKEVKVVDLSSLRELWRGTQLTDENVEVKEEYEPTVVVPLRNAVFLTIAVAYAHTIGADRVIYGAQLDDIRQTASGDFLYPDCSPQFQISLESALAIGHFNRRVEIWSPAREGLSKADNLRRGYEILGKLIFETWSCYLNGDVHCGVCASCRERRRAFAEAGIKDETVYMREA